MVWWERSWAKQKGNPVMNLGPMELVIILLIVIAIFGASRIAGIGAALGSSIREFKKAIRDDDTAPVTTTSPSVLEDTGGSRITGPVQSRSGTEGGQRNVSQHDTSTDGVL